MKPDPSLLVDVVAAKVLDAWKVASEALAQAGVRHVVIGGLAVGANGHPRATKEVGRVVMSADFDAPLPAAELVAWLGEHDPAFDTIAGDACDTSAARHSR